MTIFKNHNKTAKSVEYNSLLTSVAFATCLIMMRRRRRCTIAINAEYVGSVAVTNRSIAIHAKHAYQLRAKTITNV